MLKSCSHCGGVHTRSETCPKKQPRQKSKTNITNFRSGRSWRNKSIAIRQRDTYLCQACRANGRITYENLEVHHIIPIASNWDLRLEDDNLITLCATCHTLAECGDISRETLFQLIEKRNESGFSYER
jgi:5-methylcytosine-specific restriction protein A